MMTNDTIEIRYIKAPKMTDNSVLKIAEQLGIPFEEQDGTANNVFINHVSGCWLIDAFLKSEGLNDFKYTNITRGTFGKPYISGMPNFNISHNNDLIIGAFSTHEVGIDVEHARPIEWAAYEDSFSPTEWKQICTSQTPHLTVLDYWTVKESILKADGRGLQVSLSSVMLFNGFALIGDEEKKWYYKQFPLEGYFCCIASEKPIHTVNCLQLQID